MSIHITPAIDAAFKAYLDEPVDWDFGGAPILRKNTYPYNQPFSTGMVSFAAGYQARDMKQPAAYVPLSDAEIASATRQELDELMDFIYEYGTAANGVSRRVVALTRAIEQAVRGKT